MTSLEAVTRIARSSSNAGQGAACRSTREGDDVAPAADVDAVDVAQGARLGHVEFGGPLVQGADVLGDARAAEAEAGVEHGGADARVEGHGAGEGVDVDSGLLTDRADEVDVGDLGGEEGIGGGLGEFGGDDQADSGVGPGLPNGPQEGLVPGGGGGCRR